MILLGALCAFSMTAYAINSGAYQTMRSSLTVFRVTDTATFLRERANYAGQIIELDGTVAGLISNAAGTAFLLRTADAQMLMFAQRQDDHDIDVGVEVRVLARAPLGNAMLECLAAAPVGADQAFAAADLTPQPDAADTGDVGIAENLDRVVSPNIGMPVAPHRPPVIYNTAPDRSNTRGQIDAFAATPDTVRQYAARIQANNARIGDELARNIATHLLQKCQLYGVDPRLMFALIAQESRFNPTAVSRADARGLGQLMPGTAAMLGVRDSFDIEQNLDGSVRYLAEQLRTFGKLSLALAAYNAGPGNVRRHGGVPPFSETRNYIRKIWDHYCVLAGVNPQTGEAN